MVSPAALSLVPWPSSVQVARERMPLTTSSRIVGDSASAALLAEAIAGRTGLGLATTDEAPRAGDILLRGSAGGPREGYTLRTAAQVTIDGADAAGLFYGTQTLVQLLTEDADGWSLPACEIVDAPRFPYRGVMLDVARHFLGVADVRALIDRAAALKVNHLHLHLSDDQGWRIQIDAWPRLTARASATAALGDPGGFFTKAEFSEIVDYAASRHMTVVPEIDMPGHTHAVGVAYPELVEEPVLNDALVQSSAELGQALPVAGEPYTGWGVGHSSLRIREDRTYDFVRDVVAELAALTPGPYLHLGGDEALGTDPADFAHFVARATAIVRQAGKTPVTWHEAGAADDLAPGTIGQYWGRSVPQGTQAADAVRFVDGGGALIMSPSDTAYLDMKYDADFPLGLSWAGFIPVRTAYEWEPTAVAPVPADAVLGVEGPLWTETVRTLEDVDRLALPRLAALAEIAWSPQAAAERTWDSFRTRVGALAPLWRAQGIAFHPAADIRWAL